MQKATLHCPQCTHTQEVTIPDTKCLPFYSCHSCRNTISVPKESKNCCVICEYSDDACPLSDKNKLVSTNKHLKCSVIATIIVALCCFTPILVIALSTVGLIAVIAYLDMVLLPLLAFMIGLTIFLFLKRK